MVSRTKYLLNDNKIKELFNAANITGATDIKPLGDGEYNAVYSATANGKEYVLKIAPDKSIPVLTHEYNMMQSEVYWYNVIDESTSIRTPKIYYKDFSKSLIPTDWFIMEKLDGQTKNNFKMSKEEETEVLKKTVEMAVQIHKIHNDKYGYIQNSLKDDWYSALKSMTKNLVDDLTRIGKKSA